MSTTPHRPFRWALFGTGGVSRKFALDLRQTGAEAHVVASRNPDRARAFAQQLGVTRAAETYEAALEADVDAVYIATPPALHEPHALMAIAAGRAVLIEKPFAADAAAARRIAEAATQARVFCMEAMWTRFQPLIETAKAQITAGALGTLRGFEGRFLAANIPQAGTSLFDPDQGGALLHRGIYPLSLACHLMGPVTDLQAMGTCGDTGTDEDSVLLLRHGSGALSTIRAGLRATGIEGTVIYGTRATLCLDGPAYRPTAARLIHTHPAPAATGQAGPRRFEAFRESATGLRLSRALTGLKTALGRGQSPLRAPMAGNGYHYQAEALMAALRAGELQDPRMPLADSIRILDLVEQARAQWRPAPEGAPS